MIAALTRSGWQYVNPIWNNLGITALSTGAENVRSHVLYSSPDRVLSGTVSSVSLLELLNNSREIVNLFSRPQRAYDAKLSISTVDQEDIDHSVSRPFYIHTKTD